jgi:ubiquinone/menaquinone biosynthesis C-methylase UbiE
MKNNAEEKVSRFYNTVGWEMKEGITGDANRWEDLREFAKEYVSKCRLRVLRYIPDHGESILDMGSGPIQYEEYLEYSKSYKRRYCVDLSSHALDIAKRKIGNHGAFLCGSFFEMNFEEDFFDCTISLHTIYHIDRDRQAEAVRKLVSITKSGKPVIIVYSNPQAFYNLILHFYNIPFRVVRKIRKILSMAEEVKSIEPDLYFFAYPISWWYNFTDIADIQIMPFRSLSSEVQKAVIPNNAFGKKLLNILFNMEERYPAFFVKHLQYPIIILRKKVVTK